ncbi:MAG TPA: HNH endonuclease signature motif containing protein [Gemmataceae bacterium]|nr:HNH endonuclease signature motif containing protein [Gemmataceae bacterium]
MDEALAEEVRRRANHACEYCRMPQAFYPTVPFPVDHIIARQHGGPTTLHNLALSCLHCNSHKGPNIAGIDPKRKRLTKLFNPRRHKWMRHFRWDGPYLVGRTAVGRVTVAVLAMNDPEAVEVRAALVDEGTFPAVE